MKVSMESKYKAVSVIWAIFGALFFAGAGVMFIMRGDMPQMPRADIAYIGFLVVGAIFVIIAVATYCMAGDKNAMIEENDERAKMISFVQRAFSALFHGLCECGCDDYFHVPDCGERLCLFHFGLVLQ